MDEDEINHKGNIFGSSRGWGSFSSAIRGRLLMAVVVMVVVVVELCGSTMETVTATRLPSPDVFGLLDETTDECGEEIVTFGVAIGFVQSGEIAFASRTTTVCLSGLRALRRSGEAGSAFLVRVKAVFGETETANGLGEGVRVGEEETGEGDGVLASGLRG